MRLAFFVQSHSCHVKSVFLRRHSRKLRTGSNLRTGFFFKFSSGKKKGHRCCFSCGPNPTSSQSCLLIQAFSYPTLRMQPALRRNRFLRQEFVENLFITKCGSSVADILGLRFLQELIARLVSKRPVLNFAVPHLHAARSQSQLRSLFRSFQRH